MAVTQAGETRAVVVREGEAEPRLETLAIEAPQAGEVLVALRSVGVCHTDFSVARHLLPIMRLPGVPGHEGAGVVERVGAGVTHVAPGDRVMLSSIAPCGLCVRCQRGEGAYCRREEGRRGVMPDGTTRLRDGDGAPIYVGFNSGFFADRAVVAASAAVPVPEGVSLDVAALLGCAVVTGYGAVVNTARVRPGDSVLVMGCGGVGMSAVMGAALVGASPIVVCGPQRGAPRRGAGRRRDPRARPDRAGCGRRARGARGRRLRDDRRGLRQPGRHRRRLRSAAARRHRRLRRARRRPSSGSPSACWRWPRSGKRLVGCLTGEVAPAVDLPVLARLYRDGRLPLDRLVTGHLPLERTGEALAMFERGEGLRTVLTFT